ncbi:MAG TPA: OsmC family protein [Tenuifilaceae bacterium]|nr:OsmC family protein [Tenuifilaceae bacterium]HPI43997.1 OsmC family protein [Tenuifilaceae bacterium]HPN21307.1 OsmC family protein [Tenuifilaceae bacterium]HPV56105.1 OsmC family protein [Tenuifilaceae bacterium]
METSRIIYLGDLRTEAEHVRSGNKLITDAPVDNNGKGEFFSPTDLLATSLGACMVTIMGMSAKTHGFNIDGTKISVQKIMGTNPRRVVEIVIDLYFPHNNYSAKEKKIIELAAKECPVAQSLHSDLKQIINFHYGE